MATLKDLVANLAIKHPELSSEDHKAIIGIILDEIALNLQQQNRIEIRGFGTFSTRYRPARVARDPRYSHDENYNIAVAAKKNIYFRLGKASYNKINSK